MKENSWKFLVSVEKHGSHWNIEIREERPGEEQIIGLWCGRDIAWGTPAIGAEIGASLRAKEAEAK